MGGGFLTMSNIAQKKNELVRERCSTVVPEMAEGDFFFLFFFFRDAHLVRDYAGGAFGRRPDANQKKAHAPLGL